MSAREQLAPPGGLLAAALAADPAAVSRRPGRNRPKGTPRGYVARELGHGADLTLGTYGHTIDELDDAPRLGADEAITAARARVASGRSE